ncbi:MAG: hypothetical protein ACTHJT_00945 [Cytophaga sp.]|uniref:hypothetical protein n=1 Tax=Cytophaga sp. TaxID=29535 RepID=UPI003F7CFB8A
MERFYVKAVLLCIFIQSFIVNNLHAMDPLIWVRLKGVTYSDETVIRFREGTTTNFDFDFDAYKIMSTGTTPSVYTRIGNTDYSINAIPAADSLPTIKLGTKILEESLYTMSFANSTGLHGYVLIDKKLNTQTAVDSSSTYSFIGYVEDDPDRFELQLEKYLPNIVSYVSLVTKAPSVNKIQVSSCAGGIYVSLKELYADNYKIEIIRLGGRIVQTIETVIQPSASYEALIQLENSLIAGNYVARVTAGAMQESFHIAIVK